MNEQLKKLQKIEERINYLIQIKDFSNWGNLDGFKKCCERLKSTVYEFSVEQLREAELLDLSVLNGDGTNTVAKKGGDGIGYSGHKHQKGEKVIAYC